MEKCYSLRQRLAGIASKYNEQSLEAAAKNAGNGIRDIAPELAKSSNIEFIVDEFFSDWAESERKKVSEAVMNYSGKARCEVIIAIGRAAVHKSRENVLEAAEIFNMPELAETAKNYNEKDAEAMMWATGLIAFWVEDKSKVKELAEVSKLYEGDARTEAINSFGTVTCDIANGFKKASLDDLSYMLKSKEAVEAAKILDEDGKAVIWRIRDELGYKSPDEILNICKGIISYEKLILELNSIAEGL